MCFYISLQFRDLHIILGCTFVSPKWPLPYKLESPKLSSISSGISQVVSSIFEFPSWSVPYKVVGLFHINLNKSLSYNTCIFQLLSFLVNLYLPSGHNVFSLCNGNNVEQHVLCGGFYKPTVLKIHTSGTCGSAFSVLFITEWGLVRF